MISCEYPYKFSDTFSAKHFPTKIAAIYELSDGFTSIRAMITIQDLIRVTNNISKLPDPKMNDVILLDSFIVKQVMDQRVLILKNIKVIFDNLSERIG